MPRWLKLKSRCGSIPTRSVEPHCQPGQLLILQQPSAQNPDDIYRYQATWTKISDDQFTDLTEHLGQIVVSSARRLWQVEGDSLQPLADVDSPFPIEHRDASTLSEVGTQPIESLASVCRNSRYSLRAYKATVVTATDQSPLGFISSCNGDSGASGRKRQATIFSSP